LGFPRRWGGEKGNRIINPLRDPINRSMIRFVLILVSSTPTVILSPIRDEGEIGLISGLLRVCRVEIQPLALLAHY